ncbi:hypothetical protein NZD89_00275 [Alicyclobacillus fastidiosus]|uniref:Uncharacterized protein n=1 Tax=Alicyclobacillus fastidiosus TaxID=392011 RepID=A0ABY6ZGP2_9BACL|nr:hypothetical protein [Alicyclobacillus fastidiosus]WAH42001.1 hypothetical protein NZD89_00275 [Alicyclobacillus fastidiosus]GMA63739.1 hypothetical protein GCM10025859_41790 [Alicyclobacillus fastidiosus]
MQAYDLSDDRVVPPSVQLLFENEVLDLTKTAVLMDVLTSRRRKRFRKVSEIVFYYSIANFNLASLFASNRMIFNGYSANRYFRFETVVNNLLLRLFQMDYIEIKGNLNVRSSDLEVALTLAGLSFVKHLKSDYFTRLSEQYLYTLNTIDFSPANIKILRGERNDSNDFH